MPCDVVSMSNQAIEWVHCSLSPWTLFTVDLALINPVLHSGPVLPRPDNYWDSGVQRDIFFNAQSSHLSLFPGTWYIILGTPTFEIRLPKSHIFLSQTSRFSLLTSRLPHLKVSKLVYTWYIVHFTWYIIFPSSHLPT